jgi:hypothetical protein
MAIDPRAALDRLIAALEAHYTAVSTRGGEDGDAVDAVDDAYDVLADAFEAYDDGLATEYGEATPFYLVDDEDDDEADEDEPADEDDYDLDELPEESFADEDDAPRR